MFSFLNRNKATTTVTTTPTSTNSTLTPLLDQSTNTTANNDQNLMQANIDDAKKNLYDSINLKRSDIVVSLMNEWFKVHSNSEESIKYFFNSNFCENGTTSPLLVAYYLKDKDIIKILLNFGADPGLADLKSQKCLTQLINEDSESPQMKQLLADCFMQSIVQNNEQQVKQFLQSGFDLNLNNVDKNKNINRISLPDDNSYLHWAVMFSNESTVRLLLENSADVNAVNKNGATPLHEAITRTSSKEETLRIIETLLIYKADSVGIKGTGGLYKNLSAIELALNRVQQNPEVYHLIRDFISDTSSTHSSMPNSPSVSVNDSNTARNNSLTTNNSDTNLSDSFESHNHVSKNEFEQFQSWCSDNLLTANPNAKPDLKSLIWPQPQLCTVLSEDPKDSFWLTNTKSPSIYIYFKPPFTYTYMDSVNKLSSAFSGIAFNCIHKPIEIPYVAVTIDKTLFQQENAYSILVTSSRIDINAVDTISFQYALFTFMQLCKIYSRRCIPSLRIYDYSDIKYRAVLLDFSQGYYFKYENLLALLQMFAFYKLNQVHFYVKFSSLPPYSTKKQWYHLIENWFALMKFCEDVHLQIVPSIDISNDVAELCDVFVQIKEYLDLFKGFKFINIGPRLSSLLTCMENKNPFSLDSTQFMMLCSYLYHNGDEETLGELDKFDRYILMEYGLKVGVDLASKAKNLYKSSQPFFYCVGSANWNSILGCPDGCLHQLINATSRALIDQPLGVLMCNFSGSIIKNPFAFNLNSIVMFAGSSWNSKLTPVQIKAVVPQVLVTHGLINDRDGQVGNLMLELGHIETYLSRRANNLRDFSELPYDEGSLFTRLLVNPDDIDLDYLDKNVFKKSLFHLRAQQSKLKSISNNLLNPLFNEIFISTEIAFHLFKFLITLYNNGTRQQSNMNKPVGLNVINVGVSNLNQTIRTDLANKLLILREEYKTVLQNIYYSESVDDHVDKYFSKLIEKLLIDQDELNLIDLKNHKLENDEKKPRSVSTSSGHSNYFMYNNNIDDNQLLYKK